MQSHSQDEEKVPEGSDTFQLIKDYMENKLRTWTQDMVTETSKISNLALEKAQKELACPSFQRKGNELQYKFNCSTQDLINTALRQLERGDLAECEVAIESAVKHISKRNKFIRLADRSPSGWAVVRELEGGGIASNSEEEKRFERAERKALRKRRSIFSSRGRGSWPYPSAAPPNPSDE